MNALLEVGLFSGYKVGANNNLVSITHLQFVDDTLLIGDQSWANIRALKALLLFHDSWLAEAASVLNCKLGRAPFLYLGLPIGGDPRKLKFWQPLIDLLNPDYRVRRVKVYLGVVV